MSGVIDQAFIELHILDEVQEGIELQIEVLEGLVKVVPCIVIDFGADGGYDNLIRNIGDRLGANSLVISGVQFIVQSVSELASFNLDCENQFEKIIDKWSEVAELIEEIRKILADLEGFISRVQNTLSELYKVFTNRGYASNITRYNLGKLIVKFGVLYVNTNTDDIYKVIELILQLILDLGRAVNEDGEIVANAIDLTTMSDIFLAKFATLSQADKDKWLADSRSAKKGSERFFEFFQSGDVTLVCKKLDIWEQFCFHEVRRTVAFLRKACGATQSQRDQLVTYYTNFQGADSRRRNREVSYTQTGVCFGTAVTIKYDKFGFPNFAPKYGGRGTVFFQAGFDGNGDLDGSTGNGSMSDTKRATVYWVNRNSTNYEDPMNGQIRIKNAQGVFVNYTWHHLPDAKTMFPVPTFIHNCLEFTHTGGGNILRRPDLYPDLECFFD